MTDWGYGIVVCLRSSLSQLLARVLDPFGGFYREGSEGSDGWTVSFEEGKEVLLSYVFRF